jgi:hypothetical protein
MNEEKKRTDLRTNLDRAVADLRRYADSLVDITDRDTERKKSLMNTIKELQSLVEQVE